MVVAICAASDVALIVAGVAGMGALIRRVPHLLTVVEIAGAVFLLGYGAAGPAPGAAPVHPRPGRRRRRDVARAAVVTTLALTYLNPGVYLDTVILLGSVANSHHDQQWCVRRRRRGRQRAWFVALGYGARVLSPLFAQPIAWRVLDLVDRGDHGDDRGRGWLLSALAPTARWTGARDRLPA